jgi:hypothetical protein
LGDALGIATVHPQGHETASTGGAFVFIVYFGINCKRSQTT